MQRKFSRTASLSQSSSRSGSLSDISCDGEQLDMEESLTHGRQKYTRYAIWCCIGVQFLFISMELDEEKIMEG